MLRITEIYRSIQGEGRANYDLETGTILFNGNPFWNIGDRSGSADSIMINRESMFVSAQGDVVMEVPDDSLEGAALFQFNPISNIFAILNYFKHSIKTN